MAQQLQQRLEALSKDFEEIQTELSRAVEARQWLDAQLSENEIVQKELEQLKPENTVYKMIGPALVKHGQQEAKEMIATRLGYVRAEHKRREVQIEELESKSRKKRQELVEVQMALQEQVKQETPQKL